MGFHHAGIALIAVVSLAPAQSPAPRPAFDEFEVATIKPTPADLVRGGRYFRMQSAHQFLATNYTLKVLIGRAWNLTPAAVSGGPSWFDSDHYDILAVTPNDIRPNLDEQMTMLRKLVADRFKLAFHHEQKEFPIYALTIAKSGAKLKPNTVSPDATPEGEGSRPFAIVISPGEARLPARNATISEFASVMQLAALGRTVVDRTGLSGRFDFDLEWTPDESQFDGIFPKSPAGTSQDSKPDLFTAIQQQLGLRLEATKGPVNTIVVDHAEKPTAN